MNKCTSLLLAMLTAGWNLFIGRVSSGRLAIHRRPSRSAPCLGNSPNTDRYQQSKFSGCSDC